VLGPTEALVSLAAFVMTFVATGWRPGDSFPEGQILLAASGAAFTAIVLGQAANAFACRSTVRPAWRIPLRTNPLLVGGVAAELAMVAVFLYVPPLADLLGQAGPTVAGFAVALFAIPAVLAADTAQKWMAGRRHADRT
jgi:magnesium-transporting ATPase (P-type)